jgi:uncharacterized OB-fold protein
VRTQTSENNPFWEGLSEQNFLLQYDRKSDSYQFYPRPTNLFTLGHPLEWRPASGAGVVIAFTEDLTRASKAVAPTLLVLVRLDEGPRVFAPIVGCQFGDLKIGARVNFFWSDAQAYP